jgi:rhodanese-related sulfurtransferase
MKIISLLKSACLLIILIASYSTSIGQNKTSSLNQADTTITTQELQKLIKTRANVKIMDVRKKIDFEADPQVILMATWQDPTNVDQWAKTLSKESLIVVYCVHGHKVSRDVASQLLQLGYHAQLLEGGIHAWKELGGTTLPAK